MTLIELLIVIVVLGVIASISVISVGNIVENSRISADQATVRTLNSVTALHRLNQDSDGDLFLDEDIESIDLLTKLVAEKLIDRVPKPQSKGNEFFWSIEHEKWMLSDSEGSFYYFTFNGEGGMALDEDFNNFEPRWDSRNWEITAGGLRSTFNPIGWDTQNILYIPAVASEYDILVEVAMNDGPGYGILFDMTGNGNKNGYILQYERTSGGGGRIIIRPHINGRENPTINDFGPEFESHYLYDALTLNERNRLLDGNRVSPILITYNLNSNQIERLEEPNHLLLEVRNSNNENKRVISVYLNGVRVIDSFEYSVLDINQPMTTSGLRVWNHNNYDGEKVLFKAFDITTVTD